MTFEPVKANVPAEPAATTDVGLLYMVSNSLSFEDSTQEATGERVSHPPCFPVLIKM